MAKVLYRNLNHCGYQLNICTIGKEQYDKLSYYQKANFPDVEIIRVGVPLDAKRMYEQCLFTVNGYLYPPTRIDNRLFIANATKSMLKSRQNLVGVLSFVEANKTLNYTFGNQCELSTEAPYTFYQKLFIKFPNPVYCPIFSFLGYLFFENELNFTRVADDTFCLQLEKTPLVERLYELSHYRDIFDELEIPTSPNDPMLFDKNSLMDNAIITNMINSFNTFMVDLGENSTITLKKDYLQRSTVPGNFRTQIEPTSPLIIGYGKIGEYIVRENVDGIYTIYTSDAKYDNYLYSYLAREDIRVINAHRDTRRTYTLTEAFFLDIEVN